MNGLCPNASTLDQYLAATYPGVQSIGGVRSDSRPDHPSGHALDIMIGSDMGLGDAINADVKVRRTVSASSTRCGGWRATSTTSTSRSSERGYWTR